MLFRSRQLLPTIAAFTLLVTPALAVANIQCAAIFAGPSSTFAVGTTYLDGRQQHPSRLATKRADGSYAILDVLDRGIVHVAMSAVQTAPSATRPIFHTPMVMPDHATTAPATLYDGRERVSTNDIAVSVSANDLGIDVVDSAGNHLARIRPVETKNAWKTLEIDTNADHVYGLGEFPRGTHTDEPWMGWVARTNGEHGNIMSPFYGGVQTYTQFPVAYGTRDSGGAFAVFVDTPYKIDWDFQHHGAWRASTWGDELRYYVFTGKDLKEVHQKYLSLVGHSPVPPRGVFSNGISKFGFRNWADVDHDIQQMKSHGLPVGMVALDLYWFGGNFIFNPQGGQREYTQMGALTPDPTNFPNFAQKVADLKSQGTDVMLISESYVNANLPDAQKLLDWGCVVKDENGHPIIFENKWWGSGYMVDWTHPMSKEWIKLKYVPLAKQGIRNFWFDLGEPEAGLYAPNGRYYGIEPGKNNHGDIHNVYNLMWVKRFKQVMDTEMPNERFYLMNRSGTSGMNRFGAGKWGGDTGMSVLPSTQGALSAGDIPELIAHLTNRIKSMPLVGIDYYTSDVGGFHRWALNGNKELRDLAYTVWYADAALLDMPFRPHLWIKDGETNYLPTDTGHVPSNVANTRLRAELEPYYYQAAYRASSEGTPIVAPLFYYHPNDPNVREMGHEAYIGGDLLTGIVANVYEQRRNVYLPAGGWYDYLTNEYHAGVGGGTSGGGGQWLSNVPLKRDGNLRLPLYAREGAIIPLSRLNADGSRIASDQELRVRFFGGSGVNETQIAEDDGHSRGYVKGETRYTHVRQEKTSLGYHVTVSAATGSYAGAPSSRAQRLEMVVPAGQVANVSRNGVNVREVHSEAELQGHDPVVYFDRVHHIAIVYAPASVSEDVHFGFDVR